MAEGGHKVVALVSGGKDSCYAMMRCTHYGHTIAALANLHPPTQSSSEMDSYMYQTVGHTAIQALGDCMEVPLFRAEIKGKPIQQTLVYKNQPVTKEHESDKILAHDEVEDLYQLLCVVKEKLPHITAVCCGAVLSDYQRCRVENVCERLGLVSLAYLWQRPQDELLDEMISSQVQAILVKVAAMGLNPKKHLGKELSTLRPLFHKLYDDFGFHVCGEGGEYESFTLDCPLFKKRIEIVSSHIVIHSDDVFAPVGYLEIDEYRVLAK